MESLKVAYRAAVMIGTLILGALAYRAYGPQLEKLAPLLERAQQLMAETFSPDESGDETQPAPTMDPLTPADPPAGFVADAQPLHAPPLVDPRVQLAGGEQMPDTAPSNTKPGKSPVGQVFDELKKRGVSRCSLDPWGDNGEFYRCYCEAPLGGDSVFTRHFESVSTDPAEAAQDVLRQVSEWQMASNSAPQYR